MIMMGNALPNAGADRDNLRRFSLRSEGVVDFYGPAAQLKR